MTALPVGIPTVGDSEDGKAWLGCLQKVHYSAEAAGVSSLRCRRAVDRRALGELTSGCRGALVGGCRRWALGGAGLVGVGW